MKIVRKKITNNSKNNFLNKPVPIKALWAIFLLTVALIVGIIAVSQNLDTRSKAAPKLIKPVDSLNHLPAGSVKTSAYPQMAKCYSFRDAKNATGINLNVTKWEEMCTNSGGVIQNFDRPLSKPTHKVVYKYKYKAGNNDDGSKDIDKPASLKYSCESCKKCVNPDTNEVIQTLCPS